MRQLASIVALLTFVVCGCTTKTAARPTAQEILMQDGKLFYELGRFDESRSRLESLLAQTADERFRASATYYLERIEKGLAPDPSDPRIPKCFGP